MKNRDLKVKTFVEYDIQRHMYISVDSGTHRGNDLMAIKIKNASSSEENLRTALQMREYSKAPVLMTVV